jgi:hypothetical protein
VPRILVFHTMVGYLKSTENYFKTVNGAGYSGPESHFGVGGSWDGDALDGVIWQWQGLLNQADAQFDPANNWCTSVETSDGGIWKPRTPAWSAKQLTSLIKIGAFWCKATGVDPVVAKSLRRPRAGLPPVVPPVEHRQPQLPRPAPGGPVPRRASSRASPRRSTATRTRPTRPWTSHPSFPLPSGYYFGPASGGSHSISGQYSLQGRAGPVAAPDAQPGLDHRGGRASTARRRRPGGARLPAPRSTWAWTG